MKKLIVILIIINLGCKSSESLIERNNNDVFFSNTLYPVKYDKMWGYADFYGNTIVEPQFEEASLFQYGRAIVKKNNLYGYISNTGKWIIKPKYKSAEPFNLRYHGIRNEDRTGQKRLIARVNEGNGNFYINSDGKPLKRVELFNETGGCVQILPRLNEYSIQNKDGTYELTYNYWRITSDTTGYKFSDTTNLKLDTIIELNTEFALLLKDSKYAIYCNETSKGIDYINNQRYIIPIDSTHSIKPNFIYEEVKFENINGEKKPSSIYKKEGKWGIPGLSIEPVVPFIYLDIKEVENYGGYLVEFELNKFGYISIVFESNGVYKRRSNKKDTYVVVEHFKRGKSK